MMRTGQAAAAPAAAWGCPLAVELLALVADELGRNDASRTPFSARDTPRGPWNTRSEQPCSAVLLRPSEARRTVRQGRGTAIVCAVTAVWLLLDWLLTIGHALVVFGIVGLWIPKKTRRLHLYLVSATALSWFGLGSIYGMGYCFLTDWHWSVKRARGIEDLPHSFIHYVLVEELALPLSTTAVDVLTGTLFAVSLVLSIFVNLPRRSTRSPWKRSRVVRPGRAAHDRE